MRVQVFICGFLMMLTPLKAEQNKALSDKIEGIIEYQTKQIQEYASSGKVDELASKLSFLSTLDKYCRAPGTRFVLEYPNVTLKDLDEFNQLTSCSTAYESDAFFADHNYESVFFQKVSRDVDLQRQRKSSLRSSHATCLLK